MTGATARESDPAEAVAHAEFLRRMVQELSALRWIALDIQDTTGELAGAQRPSPEMIRKLQKIDILTQVLDDLANVTHWASEQDHSVPHAATDLAARLRLVDLVDRLAHGKPSDHTKADLSGDVAIF